MSGCFTIPFEQAFIAEPVGKRKIQESEYEPTGSICVVDQGQQLISGQTNRNDLLIGDGPYIVFGDHTRIVKYVDFPFVAGADGVRLYKAAPEFDPEYLYFFLRGVELPADGYGRHSKYLQELVLTNIKLDEQRQIASRLKAQLAEIETARQAAQTQLQDSRLLRSRLLKQFFAPLDAGPKKKLGDFAPTTSGSTPSRGDKRYWQPADIAWVKTGEVAFAPITATEEAISKAALAECSLSLLPPKTILIAMIGQGKTRGQSAILEIPATTNQNCFAVLPNATWEPDFLFPWLQASYQDLRDLSADRGGSQAALNGALLNALEVPAPSKAEQQALVLRIQAAMTEVDAIEASAKAALADIQRLPSRVLAQAFNPQGDHHGQ